MTRFLSLALVPLIMLSCTCSSNTGSKKSEAPAQEAAEMLIALSFDDGPNDVTTPKVLDILEEFQVPASFFVIGQNINDETAKQMTRAISLGCEIQNHSFTHEFMTKMSREQVEEEIRKTDEIIEKYTGTRPWMFRPPFIDVNTAMHEAIGHTFICGVGCFDWEPQRSAQERYDILIASLKDGDIVLLHDMTGNDNTVEALRMLISEMKKQGYTFVTVSDLFVKKGIRPAAHNGILYSNVLQTK
jgi:peptidoglycan/xylan/chitin deacetylase (PgdA/CDA1 family)